MDRTRLALAAAVLAAIAAGSPARALEPPPLLPEAAERVRDRLKEYGLSEVEILELEVAEDLGALAKIGILRR